MCLLLFSYKSHPSYPLLIGANRDEFYQRPTTSAAFWEDYPNVLAGRDLEKGGTWMGVNRDGKFAALTNYRNPLHNRPDAASRGYLVSEYLTGNTDPLVYLEKVKQEKERYNGFNLLIGDINSLYYYAPMTDEIVEVAPGIHGLSNDVLDTPWPKVKKGTKRLEETLQKQSVEAEEIFHILMDAEQAEEKELPETGIGKEMERILSLLFIASPGYGTRSMTVLSIDNDNNVMFTEKSLITETMEWRSAYFSFSVI